MLKFISKVAIEYNALDPRKAACVELLAQCNARKAKESNPACVVELHRLPDAAAPPRVVVTYVNGVEEVIDAVATPAQELKKQILDRGRLLETEQMFREAGEPWPVVIPEEEIHQSFPGTKVCSCFGCGILSNSLLAYLIVN
ncbi:39S ribosomal protein L53/MRP-L53 [Rhynchospora pubera]|uniref:Large ribosomal subunit protein mL53 n=1 Tax=Rhynchospora pubera TaxID=906938 RepID=A0AAV8EL04_9POAL|nr:39S ribosomal protein L53/MRP-L53 [Rhynchospora pubera]